MGIRMSDWPSPTGKSQLARRRTGGRGAAVLVLAVGLALPARGAPADDPSAIVVIGGVAPDGAPGAARDVVPGQWRLEMLAPRAIPGGSFHDELDLLARTYQDADFLRCLNRID